MPAGPRQPHVAKLRILNLRHRVCLSRKHVRVGAWVCVNSEQSRLQLFASIRRQERIERYLMY